MGDSMNLDKLKTQYRVRFYRDRYQDLPELRPGSNVLSAIKDYFHDTSGEESPGLSRSSFFADSVANINIPGSIQKKEDSSINPCISKLNRPYSTGEINKTEMKATTSSAVNEIMKTPPHFKNFDNVVSEEEVDDCESDMPLNLVVERDKETEIFRSLRSVSRDRIYSLDSSVVHGPPSPASKSSPQKRLRFSDAVIKDKESFASVFASRYNRGPAEDVQTMQMHESVNFAGNKSDATSAGSVAKVDDEEFVIEDEESINMSFSLLKKKSFFENSKEARSAASSSTHGNKNLQDKASEVISGQSPISQRKRSSHKERNEKGSNVKKGTTDERKYILSEKPEETKLTPSSATYGSQTTAKFKAMLAQSLPYSRTMQQTRQTNKEFEMAKEVNLDWISDTNPERMHIPRNPKSKVEGSKSSSVLHLMELETEPTETVYEQSTGQSQAVENTLKDAKTNKTKDSLCTDKNSFASRLVRIANIEPPKTRIDITDLPVVDEDEFVDHADFENDPASCRKKTVKIPNDSKKNKKRETNVACEVLNTTYISARKGDNATDSRKSHNDGRDSSSPLTEMAEEEDLDMIWNTDCERIKILRNPKSKVERSKSPSVSHQMEVEIEPTETVSKQSTMQSPKVGKTLKDDKTKKTKDSLCTDKSFASHLLRIANIEPRVTTRIDITDLPEVDEDEFVIHNYTDFENDPKSCKKKTVKIPKDRKKNTKGEKNVACEVLNATYTNARKSDNNATDSRNSHTDGRDSSQLTDKKGKKSRRTELDKLVLQKYLQADFDKQSESISLRPKRASAPRIPWWVVNQAERNSASDGEESLLQSPKSKTKVSADLKEPLESLMDKEENFEMKESRPLDKNEEKTLKESDAKSPKTVNSRKRTKKTKHAESEEMPGPSGVKRLKNNNCKRKPRTTRRKQKASTKLQEQLEQETQERDTEGPQENDLNVPDMSKKADRFLRAATPESPTMDEPQGLPPQKHKPVLDEPYEKSPASGSRIQHQSVKTCKCTEEREPHPPHYRLPQQSHASPAYDSARLTFQSGPVLKTRAVRYNNPMNTVVRNLSTAESLNVDMSPFTIVLDPDTNSEAISDCIHRTNRVRQSNPSLVWRCFNNTVFSAGKMVLKPTEEDVRDAPQYDILVFYIVKGIIKLKLHKSLHTLESGDFFFIPPCNTYHMKNQGREDVELVFTQLKTRST